MNAYDVVVIGAGPSGFAAAMRAVDFGKNVLLIERGKLGGAGVHDGALSSKTMWERSRDYLRQTIDRRRCSLPNEPMRYRDVLTFVDDAVSERVAQLRAQIDVLAPGREGLPAGLGNVTLMQGTARFLDPHTVAVDTGNGTVNVTAPNFVVATGSRPRMLPDIKVDGKLILTSDHLGSLEEFPESMVILGAGVIGCEFATIFSNFGSTKVFLIDRADRILPFEDPDIAACVSANLETHGVTIHQSARPIEIVADGDRVKYTIEHSTGLRETIYVERALISVGRVANHEAVGLKEIGIRFTDRGEVWNSDTETSMPHIKVVGDLSADVALVPVGEMEGRHAVERMFGGTTTTLSYDELSTIMFLDPEVASVGINEVKAREQKTSYRLGVYAYNLNSRAIAKRETAGMVKLLVTDEEVPRLLGMRALGMHASTLIDPAALVIKQRLPLQTLADCIRPHPAISEVLQDCVRMLLGNPILKPHAFPASMRVERVRFDESGTEIRTMA